MIKIFWYTQIVTDESKFLNSSVMIVKNDKCEKKIKNDVAQGGRVAGAVNVLVSEGLI